LRYKFEDCVLDIDRRELRGATGVVPIAPQVFDLLAYIIRNRDRVVSKDDLIDAMWKGRIVSEPQCRSECDWGYRRGTAGKGFCL